MTSDRELRMDSHELQIMSSIVNLLTDQRLDTEDVLTVLEPIKEFVDERIAAAKREASPG